MSPDNNKTWEGGPELLVHSCCDDEQCGRVFIAIVNPIMETLLGDDEEVIVPACYFPLGSVQSLVEQLRDIAAKKGITIK